MARRAGTARLRHRDLQVLLFGAQGPAWRDLRLLALDHAAHMQSAAATLLRWHADARGAALRHTVTPSAGGSACRWSWQDPGAPVVEGPARTARDRRRAVHQGAIALLAELAGLPEPQPEPEPPAPGEADGARRTARIQPVPAGQDPVKYLNKYTQLDVITKPVPTFTAAPKSVVHTGEQVLGTGRAKQRTDARRAAASALMAELVVRDAESVSAGAAGRGSASGAAGPGAAGAVGPGAAGRGAVGPGGPGSAPGPDGAAARGAGEPPRAGSGSPGAPAEAAAHRTVAPAARPPVRPPVPGPRSAPAAPSPARAGSGLSAADAIAEALAAGCAVSFLPGDGGPGALLLHRADGAPMPDPGLPEPLSPARCPVLLPSAAAPVPVVGWRVPAA
ncbi:hypothetical protein [Streptomyces sp. SS]|uniref:hypothetical protein n=1 Tax=Streptomyces sp. SS TaxID=260742 RepID=UPI000310F676|nr:hypothetical protein [Streptomyces sp. SS]